MRHCFLKPLSQCNAKNCVVKFIHFGGGFEKAQFPLKKNSVSVDGKPKRREKDAFSNENLLLWMWPGTGSVQAERVVASYPYDALPRDQI